MKIYLLYLLSFFTITAFGTCQVMLHNDSDKTIWVTATDKGSSATHINLPGSVQIAAGAQQNVTAPGFLYESTGEVVLQEQAKDPNKFYALSFNPLPTVMTRKVGELSLDVCNLGVVLYSKVKNK